MRYFGLALIAIILLSIAVTAFASSSKSTRYSIELDKDTVRVSIELRFHQNMTGFQLTNRTVWHNATGIAPTFNKTLSLAEFQNVSLALQDAIHTLAKNATVSNFQFSIAVSDTWINVTSSFTLGGVVTSSGDLRKIDFAWKSFQVTEDLRAGNVSFNMYSRKYLRPLMSEIINQTRQSPSNFTFVTSTFFMSNQSVSGPIALNRVGNATLLDFSPLSGTVSLWHRKYTLENHTTTWAFDPGSALDLNVRTQIKPGNVTYHFVAHYAYNVSLVVPGLAVAQGDTVVIDSGSGYRELTMVAILVILFVAAAYVSIAYRFRRRRISRKR